MKIRENTNKQQVQLVRQKLKQNDEYCPCKLVKNDETKCMCKQFLESGSGMCECGLYEKIEEQ